MDVGTWLGSLGLDQYESTFRENGIDAGTLAELTDERLRDIGVPLGHRLRMLRALRELALQTEPAPSVVPSARDGAERRHMTVMFCDLIGLSTLTAELDPEDMADLIRASQRTIAAAVARFDGHVAKWVGDGATIYFGSDQSDRQIVEVSQAFAHAHELGMATVL